jgi:prolyl-tRNA editing enzyme YbaK/EbsC (Cys-tRNA(Pro) deacylase)
LDIQITIICEQSSLTQNAFFQKLKSYLVRNNINHSFIEFDGPVKTVEQAAEKVDITRIVKSIILVDSENNPLMIILRAEDRISYRKVKDLLKVKDVRLANEEEVLTYSGYPVGGVPPFNNVKRALMDRHVVSNPIAIAGGGDINKLVEVKTKDIEEHVKPFVADLVRE